MKISNLSFKGNFLIKFPSEKARDTSELFINFDDRDRVKDKFIFCRKIDDDKLHVMTGKEAHDWENMVEVSKKCRFTNFLYALYDVIDKHFLKNAVPLDFSKIKTDDKFMNNCLIKFAEDMPDYEWLPERVEKITGIKIQEK